ncbi:hypothetical protein ACOMHN_040157 [Nucella lapillus]
MDSKLLAGAYSKRYAYIEREQLETLKTEGDLQSPDVLAKARRLSQETNRRRKLLAQKRRQEAVREEKRRQDILNRRHQEQKQATEKYQRCHVGNRPRLSPSPRRRGHSPTRSHVDIEDALRLIRGSSAPSVPNEQSREAIQRMQQHQQNSRDPLERSHVRGSRASSAEQTRQSHNRPLSGRTLDAAMRSQLMEHSMRNLTNSRTRFEQELEHHQQLLVEQQQKSLRDFNQAIRKEIDADTKVQGLEDNEAQDLPLQSESLSSLDSLEEGNQSLGSSLQEQQAQRDFYHMSDEQREAVQRYNHNDVSGNNVQQQQQRKQTGAQGQVCDDRVGRPQSGRTPVARVQHNRYAGGQSPTDPPSVAGHTHLIGPIPQGYYAPTAGAPVSSTPVIQGNLSHNPAPQEVSQTSPEKYIAVGTALRLPQKSLCQPVKQPPPSLQYDSQLLSHRRFDVRPNQNSNMAYGGSHTNANQQEVNTKYSATKVPEELTSALTQNEHPMERPKAHIYAWTSPPPEENDQDQTAPGHGSNNSYTASMVADRVMATNLHPQTCRTISTAATTTCVYQTVSSPHSKEATYTQASVSNGVTPSHQTSFGPNSAHKEIPKSQGQKPGTALTSTGTYPAMTRLKFVATLPSSYQSHVQAAESRQQGHAPDTPYPNQPGPGKEAQKRNGGSSAPGAYSLVNGRLTTVDTAQADASQKTPALEDRRGKKEVRSILKKVNQDMLRVVGQTKFNVQDSVEVAKMHMRNHEQVKRRKAQKKGVRFADLHYQEDVEEDTDSADSMIGINTAAPASSNNDSNTADGRTAGAKGTPQRSRPASARVSTANAARAAEAGTRGPRVASAGPGRAPAASRPKAAAHIIMSGGDSNSQSGSQHAGGLESGITAHKSQLDKKVTLINNNFMSRVPVYSGSATAEPPASAVYTVSGAKTGNAAMSIAVDSTTTTNSGMNGQSRSSEQTRAARNKSAVPAPHGTVLPHHSHFSTANNKVVFNENGLRIDRTPTDDEINSLWKNMRTMLDVSDGKGEATPSLANSLDPTARPQVQVSHQYIDGAALGIPNGMRRVPGYANSKLINRQQTDTKPTNGAPNGSSKPEGGGGKNGYLQRYSLLQQRRAPALGVGGSSRATGVVEQTVRPMPTATGLDPHLFAAVNLSYAPRPEEMTESMAGFLAAEQTVQTHGADIRDSRVIAAMESAQNQQEMYNSVRQKLAKGGPTALSLEEHRLLESLDKLNDRLKVVENRQPSSQQAVNYASNPASQIYVHGSGFRGHQVITSPSYRRNSAGQRSLPRPVSARLLTRPYR